MEQLITFENDQFGNVRTIEEGLIPVLPCKVGDTVYLKDGKKRTVEKIEILRVHNPQRLFYVFTAYSNTTLSKGYVRFFDYEIGRTIFLAREEAEKALKGKSDKSVLHGQHTTH